MDFGFPKEFEDKKEKQNQTKTRSQDQEERLGHSLGPWSCLWKPGGIGGRTLAVVGRQGEGWASESLTGGQKLRCVCRSSSPCF